MVYKWKASSYIKADAQAAGEVMSELEKSGRLTAGNLLEASKPETAPLHNEFEWNDTTAAEQYRISQARHLINCIMVTNEEDSKPAVRAYFKTSTVEPEYRNISAIMADDEASDGLFRMALMELAAFERKYKQIEKFKALFFEIEKLSA